MIDCEPPCFTINACNRCRRRKAKCDPGIPSCAPCIRAGAVCEYVDPRTRTTVPRSSILELEDVLHELDARAAAAQKGITTTRRDGDDDNTQPAPMHAPPPAPDTRTEIVNADLIRLEPGEDPHFLGVSSGMHLARSVLESAQRSDAHFQSTGTGTGGSQPPPSSSSSVSSPAADTQGHHATSGAVLPARETAIHLIDIFLSQYEVQYPIVVGDELASIVQECYGSGTGTERDVGTRKEDVRSQFILKMVIAVALLILSREHPESLALAKTFSSAVMADLSTIMQRKGLRTLQCLQFLLLWSILDAESAPIWYISGLCMRMCVDLGFHSETTLRVGTTGHQGAVVSEAEADTKRRLFWVTYTFDRTLGTLLGRPFTLNDSMIDVQLPRVSLPAAKRDQILHWFKLQQLQSQIVCRLYSLRSDGGGAAERGATARWKADMATQLRLWGRRAASLADPSSGGSLHHGSGDHALDWWEYWHQNAVLLLHRPSPLKPQLDAAEADTCCTAAQHMTQLSFTRLQRGSADFAWVDLHYQLMSGITLLFLVWKHAPTRAKVKTAWTSFKNCLVQWTYVLDQLARQWERIRRARDVLARLVDNTIDAVEKELCNRLTAGDVRALRQAHESRVSRNKTIIRELGSPNTPAQAMMHQQQQKQQQAAEVHHTPLAPPYHAHAPPEHSHPHPPPPPPPPPYDQLPTSHIPSPPHLQQDCSSSSSIYAMQPSPAHSQGQCRSPPWKTTSTSTASPHGGYHQLQAMVMEPFDMSDMPDMPENTSSNSNSNSNSNVLPGQPAAVFLDQQAWHGLELYETFGAIPENITMLDYFSTTGTEAGHDSSIIGGLGTSMAHGGGAPGGGSSGNGVYDLSSTWPDTLTDSILNFQTSFSELENFTFE